MGHGKQLNISSHAIKQNILVVHLFFVSYILNFNLSNFSQVSLYCYQVTNKKEGKKVNKRSQFSTALLCLHSQPKIFNNLDKTMSVFRKWMVHEWPLPLHGTELSSKEKQNTISNSLNQLLQ